MGRQTAAKMDFQIKKKVLQIKKRAGFFTRKTCFLTVFKELLFSVISE